MFLIQGGSFSHSKPTKLSLSVVSSISEVSASDWDACALDTTGPKKYNPFLTHGFLSSLEETGCAVKVRNYGLFRIRYRVKIVLFINVTIICDSDLENFISRLLSEHIIQ